MYVNTNRETHRKRNTNTHTVCIMTEAAAAVCSVCFFHQQKIICIGRCVDARKLLFVWRFWLRFHAADENYYFFFSFHSSFQWIPFWTDENAQRLRLSLCIRNEEKKAKKKKICGWTSNRIEEDKIDTIRFALWEQFSQMHSATNNDGVPNFWSHKFPIQQNDRWPCSFPIEIGTHEFIIIIVRLISFNGWFERMRRFGWIFQESERFPSISIFIWNWCVTANTCAHTYNFQRFGSVLDILNGINNNEA